MPPYESAMGSMADSPVATGPLRLVLFAPVGGIDRRVAGSQAATGGAGGRLGLRTYCNKCSRLSRICFPLRVAFVYFTLSRAVAFSQV